MLYIYIYIYIAQYHFAALIFLFSSLFFAGKTNLPHFTGRHSNSLDLANLLHTHIQGVINHGLGRFAKYIDKKEYCHDSNMVMNTVMKEIYQASIMMVSTKHTLNVI